MNSNKQQYHVHPTKGWDRNGNHLTDEKDPDWVVIEASSHEEAIQKVSMELWNRVEKLLKGRSYQEWLEDTCAWGAGHSCLEEDAWDDFVAEGEEDAPPKPKKSRLVDPSEVEVINVWGKEYELVWLVQQRHVVAHFTRIVLLQVFKTKESARQKVADILNSRRDPMAELARREFFVSAERISE